MLTRPERRRQRPLTRVVLCPVSCFLFIYIHSYYSYGSVTVIPYIYIYTYINKYTLNRHIPYFTGGCICKSNDPLGFCTAFFFTGLSGESSYRTLCIMCTLACRVHWAHRVIVFCLLRHSHLSLVISVVFSVDYRIITPQNFKNKSIFNKNHTL